MAFYRRDHKFLNSGLVLITPEDCINIVTPLLEKLGIELDSCTDFSLDLSRMSFTITITVLVSIDSQVQDRVITWEWDNNKKYPIKISDVMGDVVT